MSDAVEKAELEKALEQFQHYLSDQLAPLMVADSIEVLMKQPAELTASSIHSWIAGQHRSDTPTSISDYIYHAVMKVHLMQEYKLVPADDLLPFLNKLKEAVLGFCPADQRAALISSLDTIGQRVSGGFVPQAKVMLRAQEAASSKPLEKQDPMKKSDISRFARLVRRLKKHLAGTGNTPEVPVSTNQSEIVSQALTEVARSTSEEEELNSLLEHLRGLGIQAGPDEVFAALGRNLPGWSIPSRGDVVLPENSNLQAMRRLIAKSRKKRDAGNRFHLLVKAAIDQFNEGGLAQAASMTDLARKIMEAKEVEADSVESVRSRIHESMDPGTMRKYAKNPAHHLLLRKVLNFFPALTPQELLQSLRTEPKREQRRFLLQILEAHGEPTRTEALAQLQQALPEDMGLEEAYFRRNLLYLLRRIPAGPDEAIDAVADTVLPHADLKLPSILVKEAVALLGQLKRDKTVQALKRLLQEAESELLNPSGSAYGPEELVASLDRIIAALCRIGTVEARRTVIEHALTKKSQMGNTMARLGEFSNSDLAGDQETINRLMEILKQNLPLKRFGIVFHQRDENVLHVVEALSGTLLPGVRSVLEELAAKYPGLPSGVAAARALTKQEQTIATRETSREQTNASLTGDLDLFGLPSLVQNLADSKVTGTLILKQPGGDAFATIWMERGQLVSCRHGGLTSESAFYQLFEKPQPGLFEFIRTAETPEGPKSTIGEVLPLMLEAMRRYDEVQQLRPILPDHSKLQSKGMQPTPLADETDDLFFRDLWTLASNGSTPAECEAALSADSYRVSKLLAHWIEGGVLEVL